MHISQAYIYSRSRHGRNHHIVTIFFQHRPKKLKMNWSHLRGQDSVTTSALLCKMRSIWYFQCLVLHRLTASQSGNQGTKSYAGRAQITYIIQLYHGINPLVILQNGFYLTCGNSIQATAKGAELYHGYVVMLCHKISCMIQSGMVAPLVNNL